MSQLKIKDPESCNLVQPNKKIKKIQFEAQLLLYQAHHRISFNFFFPSRSTAENWDVRVPLLYIFSLRTGLYFYPLLRVWMTTVSLPKVFSTSLIHLSFSIIYYDYLHSFYCLIRGCRVLKSKECDSSLIMAPQYLAHKRCSLDPSVGKIPWRRKWHPTIVFLPGKFQGQMSLVGYSPWCLKQVRHNWASAPSTPIRPPQAHSKGLKGYRKRLVKLKRPFRISFNNHSY